MARLTPEEIAEIRGTLGTEISARGTVVRRLLAHIAALEEELEATKTAAYFRSIEHAADKARSARSECGSIFPDLRHLP